MQLAHPGPSAMYGEINAANLRGEAQATCDLSITITRCWLTARLYRNVSQLILPVALTMSQSEGTAHNYITYTPIVVSLI
jgi:hypothetical protein